jgi:hypothetical protein
MTPPSDAAEALRHAAMLIETARTSPAQADQLLGEVRCLCAAVVQAIDARHDPIEQLGAYIRQVRRAKRMEEES